MTFDVMDADGNGSVTREELKSMLYGLGEIVNDDYIEEMIARADLNRDGKIQFDEFVRSATSGNSPFWVPKTELFKRKIPNLLNNHGWSKNTAYRY